MNLGATWVSTVSDGFCFHVSEHLHTAIATRSAVQALPGGLDQSGPPMNRSQRSFENWEQATLCTHRRVGVAAHWEAIELCSGTRVEHARGAALDRGPASGVDTSYVTCRVALDRRRSSSSSRSSLPCRLAGNTGSSGHMCVLLAPTQTYDAQLAEVQKSPGLAGYPTPSMNG